MSTAFTHCRRCGGHHDTYECAVQDGVRELAERFYEPGSIPDMKTYLKGFGIPAAAAYEAAHRHGAANDDWRSAGFA